MFFCVGYCHPRVTITLRVRENRIIHEAANQEIPRQANATALSSQGNGHEITNQVPSHYNLPLPNDQG
jgi:hypothetical protein